MNATAAFASSECIFAASHGPAAGMTADRGLRTHMKANAGRGRGGEGKGEGGERNKDIDTKTNTRVRAHVCTHTHTPHTQTQSYLQENTQVDCMNAAAACARSECMFDTSHGPAADMNEACTQVHTHIQVCHTRINMCTTHMNMCVHFHT